MTDLVAAGLLYRMFAAPKRAMPLSNLASASGQHWRER
jgi:hypothetical protein